MPDETKKTDQTSPTDKSAAQQTSEQQQQKKSPREQELEAKLSEQGQQLARVQEELELMRPYVSFEGPNSPQSQSYDPDDPAQVLQHNLQAEISKIQSSTDAKLKALEFLGDNPYLKEHRDELAYVLANRTDKRKAIDARLKDAGKIVRDRIEAIKRTALQEKEKADKVQAEKEARTEGVMSGHQGSSGELGESDEGGESPQDYLASREKFHTNLLGSTGSQ